VAGILGGMGGSGGVFLGFFFWGGFLAEGELFFWGRGEVRGFFRCCFFEVWEGGFKVVGGEGGGVRGYFWGGEDFIFGIFRAVLLMRGDLKRAFGDR